MYQPDVHAVSEQVSQCSKLVSYKLKLAMRVLVEVRGVEPLSEMESTRLLRV